MPLATSPESVLMALRLREARQQLDDQAKRAKEAAEAKRLRKAAAGHGSKARKPWHLRRSG